MRVWGGASLLLARILLVCTVVSLPAAVTDTLIIHAHAMLAARLSAQLLLTCSTDVPLVARANRLALFRASALAVATAIFAVCLSVTVEWRVRAKPAVFALAHPVVLWSAFAVRARHRSAVAVTAASAKPVVGAFAHPDAVLLDALASAMAVHRVASRRHFALIASVARLANALGIKAVSVRTTFVITRDLLAARSGPPRLALALHTHAVGFAHALALVLAAAVFNWA